MIHTFGLTYPVYVRKSNKHNWMLIGVARDTLDLSRTLVFAKRDYLGYQFAFQIINRDESYTLDDLPRDTKEVKEIPSEFIRYYDAAHFTDSVAHTYINLQQANLI